MPAGTAVGMNNRARRLVDLNLAKFNSLAAIRPGDRRIVDLVTRVGDLDLELHAHRASADAFANFVHEVVGPAAASCSLVRYWAPPSGTIC